jgi:hypothetical protein
MPAGPILIFDKSLLQSLNVDEAMWLDNFFLTAIAPLFFVVTLADLEKEVHGGRTPELVVGCLAQNTPGLQSHMAAHNRTLLWAVLNGQKIPWTAAFPAPADGSLNPMENKASFTKWARRRRHSIGGSVASSLARGL